jgi:hypothetical protein
MSAPLSVLVDGGVSGGSEIIDDGESECIGFESSPSPITCTCGDGGSMRGEEERL